MLQLLQAYAGPGRTALSFAPTYSMYPEYARDTNTDWVVGHREDDFSLDLDHAGALIERHRPARGAAAEPQQPDRHRAPARRDQRRSARPPATGWWCVDEAYGEFRRAGVPSALELLPEHRNLVVTRTMSKAFALAGARLGYLAADPAICDGDPGGPAALPPLRGHPGGRAGGAAARARAARQGRRAARRAGRDGGLAARAGAPGRRQRREFRVVRHLPGSSCCLAGAARPGRAGPRGRSGRVAAGVDRHPGRDDVVQTGPRSR